MKTNTILGFMVTFLVALFAVSSVMASTLAVSIDQVNVNDVEMTNTTVLAGSAGETVPVVVKFTAGSDLTDLKLKVWIDGYKSEVSASTERFDAVNGSTYIKRLVLTLPNVNDMDTNPEGLTLYVRIADRTDEVETSYSLNMQRVSYSVDFLQADLPYKANAGEIIAVDVVLKNTGSRDSEDTFVTVSIPELGVSKNAYFGDIYSQDNVDDSDYADNDNEDARERRVYITLPADAKSGDYQVLVKASNYDISETVKKVITVVGLPVLTNTTANNTVVKPTTSDSQGVPTSIIVLTVVLVIIFVVLLVVLIVLLTKKPSEKVEDFGESYY